VISVPPVGRARFQLDENRAAPSGFASETNNECQIKSKLLHVMVGRLASPRGRLSLTPT